MISSGSQDELSETTKGEPITPDLTSKTGELPLNKKKPKSNSAVKSEIESNLNIDPSPVIRATKNLSDKMVETVSNVITMVSDISYTFENITDSDKCAEKLPKILKSIFSIGDLTKQLRQLIDKSLSPGEMKSGMVGFKRMTAMTYFKIKKKIAESIINIIDTSLGPVFKNLEALQGAVDSGIAKTYCDTLKFATSQPLGKLLKQIAVAAISIEKKFTNIKEYLKLENMTLERIKYFSSKYSISPLNLIKFSFGDNQDEKILNDGINHVTIIVPKKIASKTFILPNKKEIDTDIIHTRDGVSIHIPGTLPITVKGKYNPGESITIPMDTKYFDESPDERIINPSENAVSAPQTGGGEIPLYFQKGGGKYVKVSNGRIYTLNTLHDLISLEKYKATLI